MRVFVTRITLLSRLASPVALAALSYIPVLPPPFSRSIYERKHRLNYSVRCNAKRQESNRPKECFDADCVFVAEYGARSKSRGYRAY